MGAFARAAEVRSQRLQITDPRNPAYWLQRLFGAGTETAAGIAIDPDTALNQAAVFAAIHVVSEDVASLPFITYRRRVPRGKDRAPEHPVSELLHSIPNPEMTAIDFRGALTGHALGWGTGYAEIEVDHAERPIGLWPLRPDRMRVHRNGSTIRIEGAPIGQLVYEYLLPGGERKLFRPERIFNLPGWGSDGLTGYSVVYRARESIAVALAAEQFEGRFFANDARPGIALTHPDALDDDARRNMREEWEAAHKGLANAHRLAILEEGVKIESIGIDPAAGRLLETRRFSTEEIARWMRLSPHKISDFSRATFSNIEESNIDHSISTVRPWCIRWEQRAALKLFPFDRREYFAEHLMDALLRGNLLQRYQAYAIARNWGWFSADDVLELENRNPLPDGQGEIYLAPQNMAPADLHASLFLEQGKPSPAKKRPADDDTKDED